MTCITRQALTWNPQGKRKPVTCITRQALTWNPQGKRKPVTCITHQALTWNPQGKRKRGRPRNTWRRDLETETKRVGYTWGRLERRAQDRDAWRALVGRVGVGGYSRDGPKAMMVMMMMMTTWETGPGSGCLENSCRGTIPENGPKTMMMMMTTTTTMTTMMMMTIWEAGTESGCLENSSRGTKGNGGDDDDDDDDDNLRGWHRIWIPGEL